MLSDFPKMINNVGGNLGQLRETDVPVNGNSTFSLAHALMALFWSIYKQLTLFNLVMMIMKYAPPGLYIYKTIQNFYQTSKERIRLKKIELEDLQMKIQMMTSKLNVRDTEIAERTEACRRKAERLRILRFKVRNMISADEEFTRALKLAPAACCIGDDDFSKFMSEDEDELKDVKYEGFENKDSKESRKAGEGTEVQAADDGSVYSSADPEDSQDCRVKIVKVTNVYRVACLKHYVKQKRTRRASQQVLLQKKMESIKKMLESWQKSLHSVLYNKIILDKPPIDLASQEAMGNYKTYLREFSDSESELKTNGENCYDDFNGLNWSPNPYEYNYESNVEENRTESGDETRQKHVYSREYGGQGGRHLAHCGCSEAGPDNILFILPEETSSQMAIAERDAENDMRTN